MTPRVNVEAISTNALPYAMEIQAETDAIAFRLRSHVLTECHHIFTMRNISHLFIPNCLKY